MEIDYSTTNTIQKTETNFIEDPDQSLINLTTLETELSNISKQIRKESEVK